MTYFNYTIHFPECNQIKIGRTSNFWRRLKEYRRIAKALGYSRVVFTFIETESKAASRLTELEIRRGMKDCAIPGCHEWFAGGHMAFLSVSRLTTVKLSQVADLLKGATV